MSSNHWLRKMLVMVVLVALAFGTACAKKTATKEGSEEKAGKKGVKSSGVAEEDIPLANQGTLDESGRVRPQTASAVSGAQEGAAGGASSGEVLVEDIHFAFDSSELDSDARSTLKDLKKLLDEHSSWVVTLEGHCDERGTEEYNLGLGQRRASSAKSYLKSLGVPESRLDTVSFGEAYPVDSRSNEEAWAKNRRVHFAFKSGS